MSKGKGKGGMSGYGSKGEMSMSLRSDEGQVVNLVCNSTPGGVFQHPVFLGGAKLSRRQSKIQPVLVMSALDWKMVSEPKTTHKGAFGSDFAIWGAEKVSERWVTSDYDPRHTSWVAVWKFPGDLNRLGGYTKVIDTPLPVGCYRFSDDNWWQPPTSHIDSQLPKGDAVEKLRVDLQGGGSIHHLESRSGIQVAMIGSTYFIKDFWSVTQTEKSNVIEMLSKLYRTGIYAFPCYGQHHAVVFYIDLADNQRITPRKLGQILESQSRGKQVLDILEKHSRKSLKVWATNYIRIHLP
jgi:hypothetical protein